MPALRPDHRTIRRPEGTRPVALAARGGLCPDCGQQVERGEPLVYTGTTWVCMKGNR